VRLVFTDLPIRPISSSPNPPAYLDGPLGFLVVSSHHTCTMRASFFLSGLLALTSLVSARGMLERSEPIEPRAAVNGAGCAQVSLNVLTINLINK
jgi:hypothetical protein